MISDLGGIKRGPVPPNSFIFSVLSFGNNEWKLIGLPGTDEAMLSYSILILYSAAKISLLTCCSFQISMPTNIQLVSQQSLESRLLKYFVHVATGMTGSISLLHVTALRSRRR
jgi:hypothetical protein